MVIISPITNSYNTRFIESIPAKTIINSYKEYFNVNVSRFFEKLDSVQIYQCLDSGYLFYYPYNILGDELFYNELKVQMPARYNSPYYPSWKWEFDICLNLIKQSDKVYEIGCGVGNFLAKLREKGVEDVSGTELNYDSVDAAIKKGLGIEYATIQQKAEKVSEMYDVVCAFQVLEHIAEVKSFLDASIKILKKGGKLMIAVPYNNPYLFGNDKYNTLNMPPHHMGLWGKKAFKNLGEFFPLELEQIIIEKLPNSGYDFKQYYSINKDKNYSRGMPFKNLYDKFFFKWLKRNHYKKEGKNIIAIYRKAF
jgi:2-polyprenyl-3-methyl-5-hydroxy-6-metoxy-1,4-benzoquinol methylase